jgi:hypothetical protein
MIRQNILYLSQSNEGISIGLNCSIQTVAIYAQNKMSAEVLLSPLETKVMMLFFNHFPHFVPDRILVEALYPGQSTQRSQENISRVLTHLRVRIKPLDLNIKRIGQTGYFLEIVSSCTDALFASKNTS